MKVTTRNTLNTLNSLIRDTYLRRTPGVGPCRFQVILLYLFSRKQDEHTSLLKLPKDILEVVYAVKNTSKGLCNNYLEGGWEMGDICPKTKSYPPLIKQKLISPSPPPSHNDNINIKGYPPPPPILLKLNLIILCFIYHTLNLYCY